MTNISLKLLDQVAQVVASALHDIWCKERNYAPRPKPILQEDEEWAKIHGDKIYVADGVRVYDIANCKHADLTRKWQLENEASAKVAVGIIGIMFAGGKCESTDEINIELCSSLIHTAWLQRNGEKAEPLQKLDYFHNDFPEYERERDRVILREAIRVWNEMVK